MKLISLRRNVIYLFLFSLFLFFVYLSFYDNVLWWDEAEYMTLARNLLKDLTQFTLFEKYTALFKPPLLPYLLSIVFRFTGFNEIVAKLIPPLFGVLTLFVLYVFSIKIFRKESLAFLTVIFLAINPLFIRMSTLILSDIPFLFFTTLSLYFFYEALNKKNYYFIYSGIFGGLSALARYQGFIILIIYAVFICLYTLVKRNRDLIKNKYVWFLPIVFILTFSPWILFSYFTRGNPLQFYYDQIWAGSWHGSQPVTYYLFKFSSGILTPPLFILFIVGVLIGVRKYFKQYSLLLLWISVFFIIFSSVGHKEERYLIEILPLCSIFITLGISKIWKLKLLNVKSSNTKWFILFFIIILAFTYQGSIYYFKNANLSSRLAIKEASLYLNENTPEDSIIITNSLGTLGYYSERKSIRYLDYQNRNEFFCRVKNENVSHALVNQFDTSPEYTYTLERTPYFETFHLSSDKSAKVYRVKNEIVEVLC